MNNPSHSFLIVSGNEEPSFRYPYQITSSNSNLNPSTSNPETKPHRTSKACESCKIGHLSCDSERPCQRCVRSGKGHLCVDSQHKKRGKRRKNGEIKEETALVESLNSHIPLNQGKTTPLQLFGPYGNADDLEELVNELFSSPEQQGSNYGTPESLVSYSSVSSSKTFQTQQPHLITELSPLSYLVTENESRILIERIHSFIVSRGLLSERESRSHMEAVVAMIAKRNQFRLNLTEEQRIEYENIRLAKKQHLIRSTLENPVPSLVREEALIICVNEPFKQLIGFPDTCINNLVEGISLMHISSETMRLLSWSQLAMVGGYHVVPCHVKMWSNASNYKTQKIFGTDHLEGTAWITKHVDSEGFAQFTTMSFMPSPQSIS